MTSQIWRQPAAAAAIKKASFSRSLFYATKRIDIIVFQVTT
jgi:hypothetical protein